jgi:hypothetical protein
LERFGFSWNFLDFLGFRVWISLDFLGFLRPNRDIQWVTARRAKKFVLRQRAARKSGAAPSSDLMRLSARCSFDWHRITAFDYSKDFVAESW